jgi:hypothetical protein
MSRLLSTLVIALAGSVCLPAGAHAAFGINNFNVSFTTAGGVPAVQAGSHPFASTTSLGTNFSGEETEGRLRELFLQQIPGLLADTTAYPRCTDSEFNELEEGVNACPLESAVGISASSFGEPGNWITAPVFNLTPQPGELMRLGFRVADAANVVADIELSPEPPYEATVSIGEVPETIKLFGAELQLWGDPASAAHDELRGKCGVYSASLAPGDIAGFAFEGQGTGTCPVPARGPFLTLPTSCEGPQASYYEALSWEGGEDWGNASAPGFAGCHQLAFEPSFLARPTTEAAQSPSGLDISLDINDQGLTNPEGLASSQVRDVALTLPDGITAGPLLTSSLDVCSEAELEAETPEAVPGAGCPGASQVGTAEAESPLVGEPIDGAIYRASAHENLARDAAMALYVVLKSPNLGIVIAQPIGIESKPETGQLIASAEDLPQLPFSHLRLHLAEEGGGALITPPRCGAYDGHAVLTPYSAPESGPPAAPSSAFEITQGPNGGPCPTGGGEPPALSPHPLSPPPPDTTPPDTKIFKSVLRRRPPIFVFNFQSTEPGSTFRCKLDAHPFLDCVSPQTYKHLKPGHHTFAVAAIDAVGNEDPTPAVTRFMVAKRSKHEREHRRAGSR